MELNEHDLVSISTRTLESHLSHSRITNVRFALRFFHRGESGTLSKRLRDRLEQGRIPLKSFKWLRH